MATRVLHMNPKATIDVDPEKRRTQKKRVVRDYQKTVLVVDDILVNQMLARKALKMIGIRCDIAGNGVQALKRISDNTYDLVLMDIRMPIMDGIEATRGIRAMEDGRKPVPIVAFTAEGAPGLEEKCRAAGMNGYLTKPLDLDKLVRELDRWFDNADTSV